ncbi:MAG TPA: hypothetical protein PLM59_03175, partial [Oscillospiraceae bacterium]|nr:hypothetical protein [Oscillospiraceae bacterium]
GAFMRLNPPIRRQRQFAYTKTEIANCLPDELRLVTVDLLFVSVLTTPILRRKAGLFILLALMTSSAESLFLLRWGTFYSNF